MELVFLGTGAAEGIPAAYCRCSACEGVRKRGGREIKSRSSLRVGSRHQIDVPPDCYWQMIRHNTDMHDIEHVLVTHTHEDHFSIPALTDKLMAQQTNGKHLTVHLGREAKDTIERLIAALPLSAEEIRRLREGFTLTALDYFAAHTAGELFVETVMANHRVGEGNERAINYLVTNRDGRTLFYALDTGFYLDETWDYLRGRHTDLLIMDCTFAGRTDRSEFPSGHLDIASFLKMLERMAGMGFIDSETRVYATHFNPHQGLTHDGIQRRFDESPFAVTAAYDGLEVVL